MSPAFSAARELVLNSGWNSTAYQILNPGIEYWFSTARDAVVGYVRRGRVLLAAGAPICAGELLARSCAEFESFARSERCSVCYVCAEERLRGVLGACPGHAVITMGAQPVWDPSSWSDFVRTNASVRSQLNRSRNKGVEVEVVNGADAAADGSLRTVLDDWLGHRALPPLHFLVEPNILGAIGGDRVLMAARRYGRTVAFLVASPIAARNGYLVELLARSRSAPNGSVELLIDSAMRRFANEHRGYVTLGLVALARAAGPEMKRNPLWLRGMMNFARAHANRFYNFRGLEHFRTKMAPAMWEPIYAISNEKWFSVRTLYAIGEAFTSISPWTAIGIGLAKAAQSEIRTAWRRLAGDSR